MNIPSRRVPAGLRKVLYLNWPLVLLLTAVASVGFLMLYSVAGGSFMPWAEPQMKRYLLGLSAMFMVAHGADLVLAQHVRAWPTSCRSRCWSWWNSSALSGMGAQRWIDLGFIRLQPSELMKITMVMLLAAYYDWLPIRKTSRTLWVLIPVMLILAPTALVLTQPDLGTALLLVIGGGLMMFLAGVHWAYFATVIAAGVGVIATVLKSRGTDWQMLKEYQFRRIDTFLDPNSDPLGAGYHITQAKIAMGSGGWTGRGFMQGTQSRLNFLPEKHTDFIFNTLAEEFGFVGAVSLLVLYVLILVFCITSALQNRDRFSSLLILGVGLTFFLYFAVNMSMVMGLAPVVGVPLPLVSYGGSAMLVLMVAFGLVQSAHIHRPR